MAVPRVSLAPDQHGPTVPSSQLGQTAGLPLLGAFPSESLSLHVEEVCKVFVVKASGRFTTKECLSLGPGNHLFETIKGDGSSSSPSLWEGGRGGQSLTSEGHLAPNVKPAPVIKVEIC